MTPGPARKAETVEQEIAERISAAGIRLRFDKVALRLVEGVTAKLIPIVPGDQSTVFTITAPIRHPAKTRAALEELLRDVPAGGLCRVVYGNEVRARTVNTVLAGMPRALGFVHNRESRADLILDLAEAKLREP